MPCYLASTIENMKRQAMELRGCSADSLIDFGIGNPNLPVPDWMLDVLVTEVRKPAANSYMPSHGIPELRESISSWYRRCHNVAVDPERETIVTIGSKEGISHLALAIVRPGDTVVVPDPAYPIHFQAFEIAGAHVHRIPFKSPEMFLSELGEFMSKPGHHVRAVILNFPCNPSGCCVDISFFEQVVDMAEKYHFWLIHDFAYADLTYDDYQAPSVLQVPGAKKVAVEFFSMSKSYSMAGWRLGFMTGNPDLVAALKHAKPYFDYGMYRPIQYTAAVALEYGEDYVEGVKQIYQKRRDLFVKGLQSCGWHRKLPRQVGSS